MAKTAVRGRPPVGPPVTAAIPPEIHDWVLRQAARKRAHRAAIVRALIIAGFEAQRGARRGA